MVYFQKHGLALFASAAGLILANGVIAQAHAQTRPKDQSQVPAAPSAALLSPLAAHPLDALSATRDRPLFSPGRRPPAPPPVAVVPQAPPPPPPSVTLFGVIMDGNEARAIVQAGAAKQVRRVRIGDDIDGWKVTQIEGRHLVLSLDSRMATFTMFKAHGNSAPKPQPLPPGVPKVGDKQPQPSPPGTPVSLGRRGHDD
jgi:hypothetical protein